MSLSFQILNQGEPTFEVKTATEKLIHYVDTYEFETSTELVQPTKVRKPFLRSNLLIEEHSEDEENEGEEEEGKETAGVEDNEKPMSTDDHSVSLDRILKAKRKRAGRLVLINSNKIRLSIDAKTYKLQFNNHRSANLQQAHPQANSSSASRPTSMGHLQDEPTDLLVVKDFSLPSSPDLSSQKIIQNQKFMAWLANRQSELNELNRVV